MAGKRCRHRRMKRLQLASVGREVRITVRHPFPEQSKRREQTARGWIGRQLAQERLRIDDLIHQVRKLGRRKKQRSLFLEVRRGIRSAHHAEQRVISGQRMREIARRLLRLFRDLCVNHGDQQTLELREGTLHGHRALSPRERSGEHLVGVSIHAKMAARIDG